MQNQRHGYIEVEWRDVLGSLNFHERIVDKTKVYLKIDIILVLLAHAREYKKHGIFSR